MYAKCIINHTVRQGQLDTERERERICVQNVTAVYTARRPALGPLAFRRAKAREGRIGGAAKHSQNLDISYTLYRFVGSLTKLPLLLAIE